MVFVHTKTKPALTNSSRLKSVFWEQSFRDGLVWTAGLIVEKKPAAFSNFSGEEGTLSAEITRASLRKQCEGNGKESKWMSLLKLVLP